MSRTYVKGDIVKRPPMEKPHGETREYEVVEAQPDGGFVTLRSHPQDGEPNFLCKPESIVEWVRAAPPVLPQATPEPEPETAPEPEVSRK